MEVGMFTWVKHQLDNMLHQIKTARFRTKTELMWLWEAESIHATIDHPKSRFLQDYAIMVEMSNPPLMWINRNNGVHDRSKVENVQSKEQNNWSSASSLSFESSLKLKGVCLPSRSEGAATDHPNVVYSISWLEMRGCAWNHCPVLWLYPLSHRLHPIWPEKPAGVQVL